MGDWAEVVAATWMANLTNDEVPDPVFGNDNEEDEQYGC
jgi:hypothetical protein